MPADDSDGEDSDTGTGHELVAASNLSASSALAGTLRATAMLPIDDDYEDGDEVVEVFGSAVMPAQPPPVPEATQHRRHIPPPQLPSAAELAPAVVSSSQPTDLATTVGKPLSADVFDRAHKPIPVPGASGKAQAPTLEGEAEMLRAARESAAVTGGGSLAVTQHGVAVDGGISVEQDDEFGDIALGDAARGAIAASPTVPATQAVDAMGREKAAARVRAAVAAQADALAQSMAQSAAEDRALAASGAEAAQLAATIVAEADDLGGGFAAGEESSFARHGASSAVAGSTTAGRLVGGALVPMARERGDGDGDGAEAGDKYDPIRAAKASLAGVRGELQLVKEAEAEAERRESLAEARRAVEAATAAGKGGKRGGAIIEEAEEDEEEAEEDEEEEDDDTKVPSSARPSAAAAAVASGSSALPDEDAEADAEFSAATAAYRAAQAAEAAAGHGVAGAVHRAGLTVGFREAQRLLLEAVEPQEAAGTWGMPDVPLQLGSAGGWCCFGGVSLSADSQRARRSLHRIARTAFDADSALHKRVMAAVYSKLCGGDPLSPDWTVSTLIARFISARARQSQLLRLSFGVDAPLPGWCVL